MTRITINSLCFSFPSQNCMSYKLLTEIFPCSSQSYSRSYAVTTVSLWIQKRQLCQPFKRQSDLLLNQAGAHLSDKGPGSPASQDSCFHSILSPNWPSQDSIGCWVWVSHSSIHSLLGQSRTPPPWTSLTILSTWFGVGPWFGNRSCFWRSRNSRFWLCLWHIWLSGIRRKSLVNTRGWAHNKIIRITTVNKSMIWCIYAAEEPIPTFLQKKHFLT